MRPTDEDDPNSHFENYAEYSKTLRSWLVAYGIGGPVLLLTSKDAPQRISTSPHLRLIVTLFTAGVALQILLALINKWAAWQMYKGALHKEHQGSNVYKVWDWINGQSWIDFTIDVGAIAAFSIATWYALHTLLGGT